MNQERFKAAPSGRGCVSAEGVAGGAATRPGFLAVII